MKQAFLQKSLIKLFQFLNSKGPRTQLYQNLLGSKFTHSLCKLDHFSAAEKMVQTMKRAILQLSMINLFHNFL
jgi:hypothetical protein